VPRLVGDHPGRQVILEVVIKPEAVIEILARAILVYAVESADIQGAFILAHVIASGNLGAGGRHVDAAGPASIIAPPAALSDAVAGIEIAVPPQ
jgi:hypothetical protein